MIGEATAQLPESTRSTAPDIPWTKVIALRNLVAHEYFRVDLEIIQTIIREQLDELEAAAKRMLDG